MNSVEICRMGALIYPIMLTQEAGEISEAKAAELIGVDIVTYREKKEQAVKAVLQMLDALPSPLNLLLEGTKGRLTSSTE